MVELLTRKSLYPYQIDIMSDMHRFRLVYKSRQTGISWTLANESLVDSITNKDFITLFVSPSERQSVHLLKYTKHTAKKNGIKLIQDSQSVVTFADTGSEIISLPNNPNTVRGYPANHIVLDEYAFFANVEELEESITPTISRGGRKTVVSTPNGAGNRFYNLVMDAQMGKGMYSLHTVPWWECPDLIPEIDNIRKEMSDLAFRQEYGLEFLDENTSMFPYEMLMSCAEEIPIQRERERA